MWSSRVKSSAIFIFNYLSAISENFWWSCAISDSSWNCRPLHREMRSQWEKRERLSIKNVFSADLGKTSSTTTKFRWCTKGVQTRFGIPSRIWYNFPGCLMSTRWKKKRVNLTWISATMMRLAFLAAVGLNLGLSEITFLVKSKNLKKHARSRFQLKTFLLRFFPEIFLGPQIFVCTFSSEQFRWQYLCRMYRPKLYRYVLLRWTRNVWRFTEKLRRWKWTYCVNQKVLKHTRLFIRIGNVQNLLNHRVVDKK